MAHKFLKAVKTVLLLTKPRKHFCLSLPIFYIHLDHRTNTLLHILQKQN